MLSERRLAAVAQLVEHVIRNDGVVGSSPISGTIFINQVPDFIGLFDFNPALIHPNIHPLNVYARLD